MSDTPARLKSEDVIINSPMSFAGSAQRILRLRRAASAPAAKAALTTLAVVLIVVAWAVVICWYVISYGLLFFMTIPYRLLRRGARKRKAEAIRHREAMAVMAASQPVLAEAQQLEA